MAKANAHPAMDPVAGAAALDADIPRVLRALEVDSLEALRWKRPNKLSLLVPFKAIANGTTEEYLLRLGFQAYRTWPPSAQFVNPETLTYVYPQDQHFVPQLTSPECHTHAAYESPSRAKIQLICCSATLEFYEVLHHVESHHIWRECDTFLTTIMAIRRALGDFYQGRFPIHGR